MEEGLTVREIAKLCKITPKTAQKRLENAGLTPREYVGRTALYNKGVAEIIKNVKGPGRPRKTPADTAMPKFKK
jgi:Mn-dependent DtxR family transcriptional regulator